MLEHRGLPSRPDGGPDANLDRSRPGMILPLLRRGSCTRPRQLITGELRSHRHDHRRPSWFADRIAGAGSAIATLLKDMGYATARFGKNHLGT